MIFNFLFVMTVANALLTQDIEVPIHQSFYELSQKIGATIQELKTLNPTERQSVKGQKTVRIPNKHIHIVRPGDTLNGILTRYHLTERTFYQFNPSFEKLSSNQWLALSPKGSALLFQPRLQNPHHKSAPIIPPHTRHASYHSDAFTTLKAQIRPSQMTPSHFLRNHNTVKTHRNFLQRPVIKDVTYEHVNFQNLYMQGQCTYYAFERRKELANPIHNYWGNGKQWHINAREQGFHVTSTPKVGAILVSQEGPYGHVAIVEAIKGNAIVVSEMNWVAPFIVSYRIIDAYDQYHFIH
ncbi:CHAP domain-containing protein [Staphylococcus hyicus]|uniref:CHAP domain-containing protein n=1 Tax=Staphylococcus hyicus TaxID=1284 RepID=UPI00208EC9D6|nr:CHAP domain-containing protein [Staphylococcus hyicus]MCO4328532.1 CHAP domain-containing protein [Staphylococcus hyicus]MCO4335526.1 CHAP domain-containing protein [Staphylococcus hyicus]